MKWTTYQNVRKKKKKRRFLPQSRPITGTTKMKHSLKLWEVARRKTHYVQEVKGPLRYGRLPPAASQNYKDKPTLSSDKNQGWILPCVRSVFVYFIEWIIKCPYLISLLSNVPLYQWQCVYMTYHTHLTLCPEFDIKSARFYAARWRERGDFLSYIICGITEIHVHELPDTFIRELHFKIILIVLASQKA